MWYVERSASWIEDTLTRISIPTLSIEFVKKFVDPNHIQVIMNLPNNQFFGLKIEKHSYHLFLSDENFNIKIIKSQKDYYYTNFVHFTSCFHDSSIYVLEAFEVFRELSFKKYLIQQNKWETLADLPGYPNPCIWFNDKIIFISDNEFPGMYIYDIFINSWNYHLPFEYDNEIKGNILINHAQKLYFIVFSDLNGIYSCDDPFLDWNFIYPFKNNLSRFEFIHDSNFLGYYEASNYYLNNSKIYQFDLEKLEIKSCLEIENLWLDDKPRVTKFSL